MRAVPADQAIPRRGEDLQRIEDSRPIAGPLQGSGDQGCVLVDDSGTSYPCGLFKALGRMRLLARRRRRLPGVD